MPLSVTSRLGHDELWRALKARESEWTAHGVQSVKLIGDAAAPHRLRGQPMPVIDMPMN